MEEMNQHNGQLKLYDWKNINAIWDSEKGYFSLINEIENRIQTLNIENQVLIHLLGKLIRVIEVRENGGNGNPDAGHQFVITRFQQLREIIEGEINQN